MPGPLDAIRSTRSTPGISSNAVVTFSGTVESNDTVTLTVVLPGKPFVSAAGVSMASSLP
jgi:hypothetical protein